MVFQAVDSIDKSARICCAISSLEDLTDSKILWGLLRYSGNMVDGIVISCKPSNGSELLAEYEGKPIFFDIQDACKSLPGLSTLYVCQAPMGGVLPADMIPVIKKARSLSLNVVMGFHDVHDTIPDEFRSDSGVVNIRTEDSPYLSYDREQRRDTKSTVVLTVGTDNSVGKMTTAIELVNQLNRMCLDSVFAATGQTGIMISGDGVAADSVVGDYLPGTVSNYISNMTSKHELVIVEGQGSITHGTIALGLMQGSQPDGMILCHDLSRVALKGYKANTIRRLDELINIYESASCWFKPGERASVIGIAVNTSSLSEEDAVEEMSEMQHHLHVPVVDPIRFGILPVAKAVVKLHSLKKPCVIRRKMNDNE